MADTDPNVEVEGSDDEPVDDDLPSTRALTGLAFLAVFVLAATIGGFLLTAPVGFFCLAGAALVASILIGLE